MTRSEDEGLRRLAIERLGPHAPELAREALERGTIEVEHDVLAWEGSMGTIRAHRASLWLEHELCASVRATPSVVDALTAAVASAVANVVGHSLAELEIGTRAAAGTTTRRSPYRG
jgi:hypothetical protein